MLLPDVMDVSRLGQLAINDSGFVFDPQSGHTFTVNATGAFVVSSLKQGLGVEEIVAHLQSSFELDGSEDVARDVDDFLARLTENGLLG